MEDIIMSRRMDELGRVVLPAEFRQKLGINTGDSVDMELHENIIVFKNFRAYKLESDNSVKKQINQN